MNHSDSLEKSVDFRSWFMDKLLMGQTWPEYMRTLVTPFNILAAVILSIGLPLIAMRFMYGLTVVTHASNDYPWGLFLGWGLFGGVPLSATGFVMGTAYYIFGFKGYRPLVRLGLLAGFLGYLFAVIYLLVDLGRPWRIYYPMLIGYGTASVLFLVAWHVALYLTVQFLELTPAILEWLKSRRVYRWATMITIAMTIAGIILSTLHQSALGAMFLIAPGKLHPLWYSPYITVFFLTSSIYAALALVILISAIAARFLKNATDNNFLGNLGKLTIGLGKGTTVCLYVYFVLKVIGIAHGNHWDLLATPYGYWFIIEIAGFVLLPALILTYAVKSKRVGVVRFGALLAVAGIIVNRINVSIIAFNWKLPDHLHHIIPPWPEVAVVLAIVTIHILIFRWILNRLPVLREAPGYKAH
ncbi:putative Ni/Fe-hydrogenase 2 b-type cytochrome subunit [bacterium BMS3Abin07]|nr:putative Ni/Fe-hydrogenase 2 b-type cytochrome subunit [bacterium BMS3Abin07]GBE32551.1 putative Ni/Fe-hydrogenase 2 b-type cytochrome subunit [bacterium BMS3Bbin05]